MLTLSAYDKSKKKHALSLKKLEAQITQLVAQHERETKHSADQSKHEELANNRSVRDGGIGNMMSWFLYLLVFTVFLLCFLLWALVIFTNWNVSCRLSYFEERSCSSFGSQGHGEETELWDLVSMATTLLSCDHY